MAELRETPYGVFNYLVSIPGTDEISFEAGFTGVEGLNIEVTTAEYRNGNAPTNYVTKVPAVNKAGDVTLKRGVIGAQNLYDWLQLARNGDLSAKRNIEVKLIDENPANQSPVVTWKLFGAMPIKWTGPTLTAKGGTDVAIEELVVMVEYVEQS
jgi:phage tail-like protein